jgi:hypothetical protein
VLKLFSMLDFAKEDDDKEPHRLVDMIVQEVSIVDRPANQRRFLIVKRRTPMEGAQVVQKDDGTLTTAEKQGEAIPAPVQASVLTIVTAAVERLLSVAEALRATPTTDAQVDQPLPGNLAGTVADVARELAGVGERYPSPASKAEAVAKVDPIPEPVKAAVVTQLTQVAERLASVLAEVRDAPGSTEQRDAPLPAAITDQVMEIANALAGVCEKYPSPVAGAAPEVPTPDGSVDALKAEDVPVDAPPADAPVTAPAEPVMDAAPVVPAEAPADHATPAAVSAEDLAKAVRDQVTATITAQFERLDAIVKGVQARVEKVERAEGLPNSQPAQGSEQPTTKNGQDETFWPADLNDARLNTRPNTEKAPSGSPSPTL